MKILKVTKRFKKDVKKLKNQGKDLGKLKDVLDCICKGLELETKYRDHKLSGNYQKARECHIEPDWLLIYYLSDNELRLVRTCSHCELF